jgi:ribonuclease P protein component
MAPVASATKLRRRTEFAKVYEHGTRWRGRLLTGFALANDLAEPRLGIAASQKIGNAVARNRAKRRIRELFRSRKPLIPIDFVVIPRRETVLAPWPELQADYLNLLRRIEKASETRTAAELLSK